VNVSSSIGLSYDELREGFRVDVPETFNFASDVIDRWASTGLDALISVDANGAEARLSYADVARRAGAIANLLRSLGVQKGDRVIVMLPRIPEWQLVLVACLRIGAVPIPCITMLTSGDLSYRIANSGAHAVVTTAAETEKFNEVGSEELVRIVVGESVPGWIPLDQASNQDPTCLPAVVAADDPAILYYTSGSTGPPKGVLHPSRSLYAWRTSAEVWLSLKPGDVMWCTADTGWSKAGTSVLFGPWSQGATVVFHDAPLDARSRFAMLERYRVQCFCATATELRRLINEDVSEFNLSSLRLTVSAGETVNPEIVERWRNVVGTPLLDGYGQTETLMTVLNYPGMPVKPGSMGRPIPGVEAGVLTSEGGIADRNCDGQLTIRLPNRQFMLGYFKDPLRTNESIANVGGSQWFLTGDSVHADSDGYLFYTGRADDMINSSGYRIGPQEIENALLQHGAVAECAVTGVPDSERGQIVKAWVVLRGDRSASDALAHELQQHVKTVTAPYKYPRAIVFVDALPKTVSGKIQRNVLRERG
jgi:acyl-coenzyme A synthetase/AMP-(fatty) acid ligase